MEQSASLVGPAMAALLGAYDQEEACSGAFGMVGGSSVEVAAASEGACEVTFGPCEELGDQAAAGLLDTCQADQAEAETGKEEGQSQTPAEGSLGRGYGPVVQAS